MPTLFIRNQARSFHAEGVRLLPGKDGNKVSAEELKRLERNEQFLYWRSQHWIVERLTNESVPAVEPAPEPAPEPEIASELAPEPTPEPTPEPPPESASEASSEPSDPFAESLKSVNVVKAKELIAACEDFDRLLSWHENDDRQTVQDAIMKQVARLEKAAESD